MFHYCNSFFIFGNMKGSQNTKDILLSKQYSIDLTSPTANIITYRLYVFKTRIERGKVYNP